MISGVRIHPAKTRGAWDEEAQTARARHGNEKKQMKVSLVMEEA